MSLPASLPVRVGRAALGLLKHMLPPTLYFFIAFNLIADGLTSAAKSEE